MSPGNLLQFALAVVIAAIGAACLAGHVLRPKPKDRLLLWTGVFAAMYGARMFVKDPLASAFHAPAAVAYVESALNFVILIPALFFTEELYGRGWRNSLQILAWTAAAYAVIALATDIVNRNPSLMPDPAGFILAPGSLIVFAAGAAAGYRPPRFPEWRVLVGGLVVFVLFVLHEHAVANGLVHTPRNLEPIGYLVSVLCLGYIAVSRFFANARQLASTEREMQAAREIQSSILPRELPSVPGLTIAARYEPLAAVAGDFYDIVRRRGGEVMVLVADVSGHGVPAALIASMVKVAFIAETSRTGDPASILGGMNGTLCGMFERAYVTAVCAAVDSRARTVRYAIAGHPPPVIVSEDGHIRTLDERGMFLGVFPSAVYTTATVDVSDPARLILYTDGVTEALRPGTDELFGLDRLIAFAGGERARPAGGFTDALLRELAAFAGADTLAHDDVTVVVVDIG